MGHRYQHRPKRYKLGYSLHHPTRNLCTGVFPFNSCQKRCPARSSDFCGSFLDLRRDRGNNRGTEGRFSYPVAVREITYSPARRTSQGREYSSQRTSNLFSSRQDKSGRSTADRGQSKPAEREFALYLATFPPPVVQNSPPLPTPASPDFLPSNSSSLLSQHQKLNAC
jgi:hypothetical protein